MRERSSVKENEAASSRRAPKEKKAKEKKTRFTILDFFLIVVAILCVLGIGFRSTIADFLKDADPGEEVVIAVRIDDLTKAEVEALQVEDVWSLENETFGTLTSFSYGARKIVTTRVDEEGNAVFSEILDPTRFTVDANLTLIARYTEEGLIFGDHVGLYVGKTLKIATPTYSLTVTITEIPRK